MDVARFLHVNLYKGLFYFDSRFRPVPLTQVFHGVKATNILAQLRDMDRVCYSKVMENVRKGHQVHIPFLSPIIHISLFLSFSIFSLPFLSLFPLSLSFIR